MVTIPNNSDHIHHHVHYVQYEKFLCERFICFSRRLHVSLLVILKGIVPRCSW